MKTPTMPLPMNRQQRRAAVRQKHSGSTAPSVNLINVVNNPVWKALKTAPMADSKQLDLNIDIHSAFEAITHGSGTLDDINTLAYAANISVVLAERGYGVDLLPKIIDAQNGLMRILQRCHAGKSVAFDALGAENMRNLISIHNQQIAMTGESENAQALLEIHRRKVTNTMKLPA